MTTNYERLVACIEKPPEERSLEEVSTFCEWFGKLNTQFEKLKPEVICDILKNSEYSVRPKDNVIIKQFDVGDCFYIILSGKASIFINTDSVPDDEDEAVESMEDYSTVNKKELDRSKYGTNVGFIASGKSFGELALINKNSKRNATIIADETTQLLVVNRDLYNRSLKSIQEAEFRAQMDFVHDNKLFRNWPARYKRQAGMSLRKQVFEFGMPIVQQGQPLNGLAFILNGQAKVIVDCLMHHVQYPELRLDEDPEEIDKRESQFAELGDRLIDAKTESKKLWEKPFRRHGYAFVEQRLAQKHLEIALVGPGETIGDIENGLDLSTYAQSVICEEKTECYVIDAKNFERLLNVKRNPRSVQMLKHQATVKLLYRVERTFQKEIPLLKNLLYRIDVEKRQALKDKLLAEQQIVQVTNDGNLPYDKFIPKQGLLIDMYGPGTVFYRNRTRRENKRRVENARQHLQAGTTRLPGIGVTIFSGISPSEDGFSAVDGSHDFTQALLQDDPDKSEQQHLNDDWETSSEHLETLEHRMKDWHEEVFQELVSKREKESVFKLKRFKTSNPENILPGKKIVMRPKTNNNPQTITFVSDDNQITKRSSKIDYPTSTDDMILNWDDGKFLTDYNNLDLKAIENVHKENSAATLPELKLSQKKIGNQDSQALAKIKGETRLKSKMKKTPPQRQYTKEEYEQLKMELKSKEIKMKFLKSMYYP